MAHRDLIDGGFAAMAAAAMGRRSLLKAGGLAAAGLLAARQGFAQDKPAEIVLANWGGDATQHFDDAFCKPFTADTGIPVVIDGSGPETAKIRAMVEAGNVAWDVVDSSIADSVLLGGQGLLRKIDYSIVSKDKVVSGLAYEYGVANYLFSNLLAYDAKALGGKVPQNWAEFWDVEAFPGMRTLRRDIEGVLEVALLADGVALDAIYPIDEDRAFKKLKEIVPHTIFWSSGSESQQLMRDGEAVMGCLWSTRATQLNREDPERFGLHFNQGQLLPGSWVVPTANPAGDFAFQFIASMQTPERQAKLFDAWNLAPANPAAAPFVSPDKAALNPTSVENLPKQFSINVEWYIENQERVKARFLEEISG